MELKDYTTEQLREELKRRAEIKKQEHLNVDRCRNCKHLIVEEKKWWVCLTCGVRTYFRKGREYHYMVKLSTKACDKYERKEE